MLKIGLTGGIGSGKSTVAEVFKAFGVPVFNSDLEASKITQSPEILLELVHAFGQDILDQQGLLDRKCLAELVFKNPEALQRLNNLIHPKVKIAFQAWLNEQEQLGVSYVLKESAILFETVLYQELDQTILVVCPEQERVQRIKKRNPDWTLQDINNRIQNQWPDEKKMPLANFVIHNQNNFKVLQEAMDIHDKLITSLQNRSIPSPI